MNAVWFSRASKVAFGGLEMLHLKGCLLPGRDIICIYTGSINIYKVKMNDECQRPQGH